MSGGLAILGHFGQRKEPNWDFLQGTNPTWCQQSKPPLLSFWLELLFGKTTCQCKM